MEREQHDEWMPFREAAVDRLCKGSSQNRRGVERLFRFLRLPSFDPSTIWEVFCDHSSTPDSYFIVRTIWRMDVDVRKFESPVERLKHPRQPEPTFEMSQTSLDSRQVEALLGRLRIARVSPLHGDATVGCDGTSFEVHFGEFFHHCSFHWWCDGPTAWQGLTSIVVEAIEVLEKALAIEPKLVAEEVTQLRALLSGTEANIPAATDLIMTIAAEHGRVECQEESEGVFRVWANGPVERIEISGARPKLRMICAKVARICSDQSGSEFSPYGGNWEINLGGRRFRIQVVNQNRDPARLVVEIIQTQV